MANRGWFVARTKHQHEMRLHHHCEQRGLESYLPIRAERRTLRDRAFTVERPLLRNYLFLHLNADDFATVYECPNFVGWVKFGRTPALVSQSEIDTLRACVAAALLPAPKHSFTPGDPVTITSGPFIGTTGVVISTQSAHYISIRPVACLNASFLLNVPPDELVSAASDSLRPPQTPMTATVHLSA